MKSLYAILTRFWTHSIRRQLMLGIMLVHAVLMSFLVFTQVERQRAFLHRENVEHARGLTNMLATNSATWVLSNDVVGLNEVIRSLRRYPDLRYAMVLTPEGRVLGHSNPAVVGLYIKDNVSRSLLNSRPETRTLVTDDVLIDIATPIMAGTRHIGWARIGMGQERQAANLHKTSRDGAITIFAAILVGMLFAMFMARGMTAGLRKLVDTAEQIRLGRRDVRAELKRSDEIGKLGNDLNLMLDVIMENENRSRLLLDSTAEGIFGLDTAGKCTFCNPAAARILGYNTPEDLLGKDMHALIHAAPNGTPCTLDKCKVIEPIATGSEIYAEDDVFSRLDGTRFPVRYWSHPIRHHGSIIGVVVSFSDITEHKAAEAQIQYMAQHDTLTGLPNRALLRDRMFQALANAQRDNDHTAILFIDLDRFKIINDSLGHPIGDLLLQEVSKRLLDCVRGSDTVSRQGGDEFVIVLSRIRNSTDAVQTARKIIEVIAIPYSLEGHEVSITPSIGISIYPDDGSDVDILIKNADAAMYQAKARGRNNYVFFTEDMNTRVSERLFLENSLQRALELHEFILYFQPQVNLATGAIIGMEALVRWLHPELGVVLPSKFIPVAEDCNLIVPLGEWVLSEACRQNRAWQAAGLPAIPVTVNMSPVQFRQKNLADSMAHILNETGLDPRYLELELTEELIMQEAPETLESVRLLRNMGLRLSVDDFGTGYSSLSCLKRLAIDKLKIDSSFVHGLPDDQDAAAITRAMIGMAHSLRLTVLAEGVETAGQLAFLRAEGCDEIQGYYFSIPQPPQEMERLLRAGQTLGEHEPRSLS